MTNKIIFKTNTKTCCGGSASLLDLPVALTKKHLDFFKNAGYIVPEYFVKAGIFHVELQGLVASGSLGSKRLSLRIPKGDNGEKVMDSFIKLLEQIL